MAIPNTNPNQEFPRSGGIEKPSVSVSQGSQKSLEGFTQAARANLSKEDFKASMQDYTNDMIANLPPESLKNPESVNAIMKSLERALKESAKAAYGSLTFNNQLSESDVTT